MCKIMGLLDLKECLDLPAGIRACESILSSFRNEDSLGEKKKKQTDTSVLDEEKKFQLG